MTRVAAKNEQLQGSTGKLEIYPLNYVHPYALNASDKYFVELVLEGSNVI